MLSTLVLIDWWAGLVMAVWIVWGRWTGRL